MKKLALSLVALSALGLAACGDRDTTNAAAGNTAETENAANADVNAATAAQDALDTMGNAASDVGNFAENTVDAAGNAIEDATK